MIRKYGNKHVDLAEIRFIEDYRPTTSIFGVVVNFRSCDACWAVDKDYEDAFMTDWGEYRLKENQRRLNERRL